MRTSITAVAEVLCLLILSWSSQGARGCRDIGGQTVREDPRCSRGQSLGCNAGGQGQNCRFCGFANFPACPGASPGETSGEESRGGCHDIGGQTVREDPRCSRGESLGCNAGGQGQNCRFCGFANFPACPGAPRPTPRPEPPEMRPCRSLLERDSGSGCRLPDNHCLENRMECARYFAPVLRFHPDEYLWPDSVDQYLRNSFLGRYEFREQCRGWFFNKLCVDCLVPRVIRRSVTRGDLTARASFNPSRDDLDSTIFLIPNDKVSSGHSFLNARGLPSYIVGNANGAPLYMRFKQSGNRLEIQYNIYFPLNGGKSIGLQRNGNHFGDWEDVSVLVEGNQARRIYVHAHGSGNAYDWSFNDGRVRKVRQSGVHPVVYIAKASHGTYLVPGTDYYTSILKDDTADGGREWRTWGDIREMDWEFRGRWGTRRDHYGSSDNTCVLDKDSEGLIPPKMDTGPSDPNRGGRNSGFKWL